MSSVKPEVGERWQHKLSGVIYTVTGTRTEGPAARRREVVEFRMPGRPETARAWGLDLFMEKHAPEVKS